MDPLSEREREREREREKVIMYGKYPGQYMNCMIYSDQTVRKYSRHVMDMCALKWPFLSFLKSHKTYSGRTFSLTSLSFITPPKNIRITRHSFLHLRFYLFIALLIYEAVTYAYVCGTSPGNRLSTRRNTQDDTFCL